MSSTPTPPPLSNDADTDTESPSPPSSRSLSPHRSPERDSPSLDRNPSSAPSSPRSQHSPRIAEASDDESAALPATNHLLTSAALPLPASLSADSTPSASSLSSSTSPSGSAAPPHFVWRIDNFPHLRAQHVERHLSPEFELEGQRWRMLLFPCGNRQPGLLGYGLDQSIALYLQMVGHLSQPPLQSHQFSFTVIPPSASAFSSAAFSHTKDSTHRFTNEENDRGFNPFLDVKELPHLLHPPHNSLVLRITVQKQQMLPYSWPDANYDSKAMTGFVGLKNQGATCYMNSLLQTLYHLPVFRQLLYSLPTEGDTSSSVPLSLQRLFYHLQTSDAAVSTKQLTVAFGWNSLESWQQHDVQEFSRVLLDNISERVKKTEMEGKPDALFAGKSQMYIECFPESDHRVLTDAGLLFLDEIEHRLQRGDSVLYACYDVAAKALCYRPGKLVFPPTAPAQLLEFNSPGEERRWTEGSGQYGIHGEEEDEAAVVAARHLSLRVTPRHRMYVEFDRQGEQVKARTLPASTVPASSLLSACKCPAMQQAAGAVCCDHRRSIRMVACAESGYVQREAELSELAAELSEQDEVGRSSKASRQTSKQTQRWKQLTARAAAMAVEQEQGVELLSVISELGLHSAEQWSAFQELLGFWLGNGSLSYACSRRHGGRNAVVFYQVRKEERRFLRLMASKAGLSACHCQTFNFRSASVFAITDTHWFQWFDRQFGLKNPHSRHYDAQTAAETQPFSLKRQRKQEEDGELSISSRSRLQDITVQAVNVRQRSSRTDAVHRPLDDDEAEKEEEEEAEELPHADASSLQLEEAEAAEAAAAVKSLPAFVLQQLTPSEIFLIIRGLWRTDGSWKAQRHVIHTSSIRMRDQLIHALLLCGFTACARLHCPAGSVRGYRCVDRPLDSLLYSVADYNCLSAEEQRGFAPVVSRLDSWSVYWSEPTTSADAAACWPSVQRPSGIRQVAYSAERDGRLWCVTVAHADHLIVAQRAERHDGVVTKQSRPVVVGQCIHVPYKSERVETYLDLAMNVKGCKGLKESFEQYVEVEILDKDNAYRAEHHGLQEARKGSRFLTFPPVLQLQLKRFEYNVERDMNVKLNDRFEFPTSIDLSPFLAQPPPEPDPDPPLYFLHSVLVHSGSGHGGHYYCYIRPFFVGMEYSRGEWYKFDDETVHKVTEEEATVGNYGGELRGNGGGGYFPLSRMSVANAYMLVYVRKSVVDTMLTQGAQAAWMDKKAAEEQAERKHGEPLDERKAAADVAADGDPAAGEERKMDVEMERKQPPPRPPAAAPQPLSLQQPEDAKMKDDDSLADALEHQKEGKEADGLLPAAEAGGQGGDAGDMLTDAPPAAAEESKAVPLLVPLPASLLSRFQREEKEEAERRERARRAHLYTELKLISEAQLIALSARTGCGCEMRVGKEEGSDFAYETPTCSIKVMKAQTLRDALTRRADWTAEEDWSVAGIPVEHQQYWKVTARENETERPNSWLAAAGGERGVSAATADSLGELKLRQLFVRDDSLDDEWPQWTGGKDWTERDVSNERGDGDRCLLMIKFFDLDRQRLRWAGSVIVLKSLRIRDVKQLVHRMMAKRGTWRSKAEELQTAAVAAAPEVAAAAAEGAAGSESMEVEGKEGEPVQAAEVKEEDAAASAQPELEAWEEENTATDKITPLPDDRTVEKALLRNGDLLCLQHRFSEEERQQLSRRHTLSHSQQHTLPPPPASAKPSASPLASLPPASTVFFADAPAYLRYLYNRLIVEFRLIPFTPPTKERPFPPSNVSLRLEMSKAYTFRDVLQMLAAHVQVEPGRISLYRASPLGRYQHDYMPIDRSLAEEREGLMGGGLRLRELVDANDAVLYYEIAEFDPRLLHDHYCINCVYVDRSMREETMRVLVKKQALFRDAETVVKQRVAALRKERRERESRERREKRRHEEQQSAERKEGQAQQQQQVEEKEAQAVDDSQSFFSIPCNLFSLSLLEKELRVFSADEPVGRFFNEPTFGRSKNAELVVEEQSEEQQQAELRRRERLLQRETARAEREERREEGSGAGALADSSDDDSEGEEADRQPQRPFPPVQFVYRFVAMSTQAYRLCSHPFSLVIPQHCTAAGLLALIQRRLLIAKAEGRLRLGLLSPRDWLEMKTQGEEGERELKELQRATGMPCVGVWDLEMPKPKDYGALAAGYGVRPQHPLAWRGNNAAVRIFSADRA